MNSFKLMPGDSIEIVAAPREPGYVTHTQWMALVNAETKLYDGAAGSHSYTSVNVREDDGFLIGVWAQAEIAIESTNGHMPGEVLLRQTARRVAQTLACLSFGPEFLLK